jgi:hypothetical protein
MRQAAATARPAVGTGNEHVAQLPENPSVIASRGRRLRLSEVVASFIFSVATFEMLVVYGIVHWNIMFRYTPDMSEPPEAVFTVLGHLSMLRLVFSVLALVWAVWSFRGAPRWAAWTALGFAVVALLSNAVMT